MSRPAQLRVHSLLTAGIVLLAGCATTAATTGELSGRSQIEGGGGRGDPLSGVTEFKLAQRSTVPVPVAQAWPRLVKAYSDLGIPLTSISAADRRLGNEGMKRSHTLANSRISDFLDCGTGGGGANADTYSINMSVASRLQALTDSTTEVSTMIQATATPMSFGTPPVVCSTLGSLEARIASLVANGGK
jgi:hypothetical protein